MCIRFEAVHGVCVSDLGRSLLGEFSPDYLADFALHGAMAHQHLLQSIMGDLEHAVLVSDIITQPHLPTSVSRLTL